MKNNIWSTTEQSSELLYYTRAERFNDENKNVWFKLLNIKNGMRVLEVGCAGGLFTNMIKKHFPNCEVCGIDLDQGHIKFAKQEAKKQNLDVKYLVADVGKLPFKNDYFDLVYSHTVVEHVPFDRFVGEQKRVLKRGGKLIIMKVDTTNTDNKPFLYLNNEINAAYKKLIIEKTDDHSGKEFLGTDVTMQKLCDYGFNNINYINERIYYYMPDVCSKKSVAIKQIERNYKSKLFNALFNLKLAKNGKEVEQELIELLKNQYEKRLEEYNQNKKLFDYQSTSVITISATKQN